MKSSFLDGEIQVLQTKKFSKPLVRLQHQLSEIKRSTCRLAYRTSYLPYGPWASDGSVTHGELIIRHCDFFIFIHIYANVCNISSSFFGSTPRRSQAVGLSVDRAAPAASRQRTLGTVSSSCCRCTAKIGHCLDVNMGVSYIYIY